MKALRRGAAAAWFALACAFLPVAASAEPSSVRAMASKIRAEEANHSELIHTEHVLADRYGPRLTASPSALAAGKWALRQMASWGLSNGHLEPWSFGHPGWTHLSATGFIESPAHAQFDLRVIAWTRGTNGELRATAVEIDPPRNVTRAGLMNYLDGVRHLVRGKIVLVGSGTKVERDEPFPPRYDDKQLDEILHSKPDPPEPPADPAILTGVQWSEAVSAFLVGAGAKMRVDDSMRPRGMIIAYANWTYDPADSPPWVIPRHEDYSRIVRLLNDAPVTLAFDIRNRLSDGRFGYNAVAEIPGTDLRRQLVIIGAHLDSWHAATGAIDDGIGCAVMMEAMRILKALNVHPRRTVRIVLWTGEEQGLYGSQAYVAQHFRDGRGSETGLLQARGLYQYRRRHRPNQGGRHFRAAERCIYDCFGLVAFCRSWSERRARPRHPQASKHGCDDLLARGATGDRAHPGSDRIWQCSMAFEPRYL